MSISDLDLIFENEKEAFFLRQSNRNKYYYKGTKTRSRVVKLQRIKGCEFWDEFQKNKQEELEQELLKIATSEPLKEVAEPQEVEEPQEIEEEKPKKRSFLDIEF